jgi:hypothetical protein
MMCWPSGCKAKRGQVSQLLPMLECNPEMVAVAFHGGMRFASPEVMHDLTAQDPEDLPPWATLLSSVSLEPWAEELAEDHAQGSEWRPVSRG